MSVELIGKWPILPEGRYMGMPYPYWGVIWRYLEEIAPELTKNVNPRDDYHGMDVQTACLLSARLQSAVKSGHAQKAVDASEKEYGPDKAEPCTMCKPEKLRESKFCYYCLGTGKRIKSMNLSINVLNRLAQFFATCGGFRIM